MRFELIDMSLIDWGKTLDAFPDKTVFQTPAWLSFIAESQRAKPIIAALKRDNEILGYFNGFVVQKFGLRILCSPLRGWSTPYLGFNLLPGVPRRRAVEALSDFAFKTLGCIHFELVDSRLTLDDIAGLDLTHEMHPTLEIDLTQSEEVLFNNMSSACRRNIRKAEKSGVVIEEAQDAEFADEYSAQFEDVFGKQGMVPHFGADRVRTLIKHLHSTGMLLLLRARNPEGRCIATGVFPAMDRTMFLWGNASWRESQILRPNEMLYWYAMRYWKQRGIRIYNMVGTKDFKQKFGGYQTAVPMIRKSRYRVISHLRASAPQAAKAAMHLMWKLRALARH